MSADRRAGNEVRWPDQSVRHYDREERLARKQQKPPESGGGLFTRNRSLLIVLLDIVLVLMMFALYLLFFRTAPSSTEMSGFIVNGNAFVFDGEVYLTVTISRDGRVARQPQDDMLVELSFPGGITVIDTLPVDPDRPTTIRHIVSGDPARSFLDADEVPVGVTVRGRTRTVALPLRH